ncbi:MAG: hypothetical protein OK454_02190 [Thaumarchaeota archaeon]|nr:hypothetical protein [Nitrososphaerota archaeon]
MRARVRWCLGSREFGGAAANLDMIQDGHDEDIQGRVPPAHDDPGLV